VGLVRAGLVGCVLLLLTPAACGPGAAGPGRLTPTAGSPAVTSPRHGPGQTDPEQPRDLVAGRLERVGTVEHSGGWVLLRAGTERWALLGAPPGLRDGARVEAIGRRTAAPPGCPAALAMRVSTVRPR
jgi:hypothetical protein